MSCAYKIDNELDTVIDKQSSNFEKLELLLNPV